MASKEPTGVPVEPTNPLADDKPASGRSVHMEGASVRRAIEGENFLEGKLLIALPGMADPRFEKSVIFMCAHSLEGAMGIMINRPVEGLNFRELMDRLELEVTAGTRDMPVYVRGLGTVQAYNSVSIKSRVDGQIVKVDFKEGQEVKAGDLLFEIDPRPFQAALAQAKANKDKDEAQLASASADLKRDEALVAHDFQTRQAFDQQKALVGQIQASIAGDDAQIDTAQLNLQFADIRAPIDVHQGDLPTHLILKTLDHRPLHATIAAG